MRTVNEVSKLTGVSIRTLHYYDKIGLLSPSKVTEAGYRLYDDTALERLQQILLFRELEFPLKEIREILDSDRFDRNKALEQQIKLLTLKKEHLENLIRFARGIKQTGVKIMDFNVFDTKKIDEYSKKAKEQWRRTEAYQEFEQKNSERSSEDMAKIYQNFMQIFIEFAGMKRKRTDSIEVQRQVRKLQDYISEHFYQCTPEILQSLGKMYSGGGEFTSNIDKVCGEGSAEFVADAIEIYCRKE